MSLNNIKINNNESYEVSDGTASKILSLIRTSNNNIGDNVDYVKRNIEETRLTFDHRQVVIHLMDEEFEIEEVLYALVGALCAE